jgi:hypothetical protein
MQPSLSILYTLFLLGLLFVFALAVAKTNTVRGVLFWLGLVVMNLGALVVLLAVFAVSRLDGSGPPGADEVLAPFWLPIALIGVTNGVLVLINRWVKLRINRKPAD